MLEIDREIMRERVRQTDRERERERERACVRVGGRRGRDSEHFQLMLLKISLYAIHGIMIYHTLINPHCKSVRDNKFAMVRHTSDYRVNIRSCLMKSVFHGARGLPRWGLLDWSVTYATGSLRYDMIR